MQFYKIRDFSEKLSASVQFFRENLKSLVVIGLTVGIPVGIASSFALSSYFGSISSMGTANDTQAVGMISSMMGNMGLYSLLSILAYALLTGLIYTYMMNVENGNNQVGIGELLQQVMPKLPGLMVVMLLILVMSSLGFMLFFIPGLYLIIVLSLAIPTYLFEGAGIGQAISKPFKLIKSKWWSTFGLLFISSLIAGLASYIFAIPMYATMFAGIFETVDNANTSPDDIFESYTSWQMVASTAVFSIGAYILYSIPIIALAFQYFNLKERTEATGIKSEIDTFEELS